MIKGRIMLTDGCSWEAVLYWLHVARTKINDALIFSICMSKLYIFSCYFIVLLWRQ